MATVLLLLTMIPMGIFLTSATTAAVGARQQEAALQLADSWVEILSDSPPLCRTPSGAKQTCGGSNSTGEIVDTSDPLTPGCSGTGCLPLPAGVQGPPTSVANTNYTVTVTYNWAEITGTTDACSAQPPSPSHPGVISLHVLVTWNGEELGQQALGHLRDQLPAAGTGAQ